MGLRAHTGYVGTVILCGTRAHAITNTLKPAKFANVFSCTLYTHVYPSCMMRVTVIAMSVSLSVTHDGLIKEGLLPLVSSFAIETVI